jgi:hypothetical protein
MKRRGSKMDKHLAVSMAGSSLRQQPQRGVISNQNVQGKNKYEAHPQSMFPWGRLQKQNTISSKDLLQQIQQVFSYFSTYSPPELRHLTYRGTNS